MIASIIDVLHDRSTHATKITPELVSNRNTELGQHWHGGQHNIIFGCSFVL